MQKRDKVTVTLDSKLITKLDLTRGMIPRSRYVEKAIIELLETTK